MRPWHEGARTSLRRRIVITGVVVGLVLLGGSLAFLRSALDVRDEIASATEILLQEQLIANRITQGVMRQLANASAFSESPDPRTRDEFRAAGDEVYGQIRRYLFFDLSPDARIRLERMREDHQQLEVLAARTAELFARGEIQGGEIARTEMVEQAFVLLDAVEAFVLLRDAEFEALRSRQDSGFNLLFAGGAAASILAGLAVLLLALLLHRRVARPLAELAEATERMAAGDLAVRVPSGRDREFHVLATGFNRMAAALEGATRDLEERNRDLSLALDQVHDAQAELIQTEKLSAMGRMAAGLAHELNNPLASVLGFGELLESRLSSDPPPSPEELDAEFVRPIVQEATRAQHLVRNFLHFSRRSGATLEPVSLRQILEVVIALREYGFRQAGVELQVEEIPDVRVRADPQMLQGVLLNVINNALQAITMGRCAPGEETGGTLAIRARIDGPEVSLIFEDDGPGIEDPERIFEPFYTTKPVGEGTGLGLAVAHRFMESFGGRIAGENRDEGGARFVLYLRVDEGAHEEAPEGIVPAVVHDSTGRVTAPGLVTGTSVGMEGPAPGGLPPGLRILVVEDEEPLRRLQQRILSRFDVHVLLAHDGADARRILESEAVDLVVSDVRMPGESGLDLYRWIRSERPELTDRFLFVTGDIGAPELTAFSIENPGLFLHKPFDVDEYVDRIRGVLSRRAPYAG